MAKRPSLAQRRALRWLADHGGHASLDQYGRAIARGERCSYTPATWLRLFIAGHIAASPMADHFGITATGLSHRADS
jgi:hypothetical protein